MLDEEERRLLSEIQESDGKRYVPGNGHIGGAYASLTRKKFLFAKLQNAKDNEKGELTFDGTIFYITPEGANALKNGDYAAKMLKLLESLTPEQAEFLIAVMRQMLKPIKDYVK